MLPFWVLAMSPAAAAEGPKLIGAHTPDEIVNGTPTQVVQAGVRLAGVTVKVSGACKLLSFKVLSDTKLQMTLQGTRHIEDEETACYYEVSNASGSDRTWILVSLTPAEEAEKARRQQTAAEAQANDIYRRLGREWDIVANGDIAGSYVASGHDPDGLPEFRRNDGKILVAMLMADGTVSLIPQWTRGCMYSGTLKNGKVADGQSFQCGSGSTAWTATVKP